MALTFKSVSILVLRAIRNLSSTFLLAGLSLSLKDALTLDLPLQDEEYIPISLLEQGGGSGAFNVSHEASKKQKTGQARGNNRLSSLLNRRSHRRHMKVICDLQSVPVRSHAQISRHDGLRILLQLIQLALTWLLLHRSTAWPWVLLTWHSLLY